MAKQGGRPPECLYVETIDNLSSTNMLVSYPKSLDDVQPLIVSLRSGQSVIFDLQGVARPLAQRMLDFVAGATFALGGSMQRIQNALFVATQQGVGIRIKR